MTLFQVREPKVLGDIFVGNVDYKCEWNVIRRWIRIEEETNQGQLRKRIENGGCYKEEHVGIG